MRKILQFCRKEIKAWQDFVAVKFIRNFFIVLFCVISIFVVKVCLIFTRFFLSFWCLIFNFRVEIWSFAVVTVFRKKVFHKISQKWQIFTDCVSRKFYITTFLNKHAKANCLCVFVFYLLTELCKLSVTASAGRLL